MGTSRKITERQLEQARSAVEARVKILKDQGIDPAKFADDPMWRQYDAKYRQVHGRLRKVGAVESLNAEVTKHKSERLAKLAEEKTQKKQKKAPEAEAKPAKKGKEAGGKEKAPAKPKKEKAEKPEK